MSQLLLILTLSMAAAEPPPPLDGAQDPLLEETLPAPDPAPLATPPLEVGLWQMAAGGGACFLLACPGAPLTLGLSLLAGPALVGWLTTTLGDSIGQQRAPWLWTMVGAYAGAILFGGVITGATVAGLIGGLVAINSGGGFTASQIVFLAASVGGVINLAATSAATGAGAAIGYALTAEDKRPGDDGSAPAGFSSPGHPDDGRAPVDDPSPDLARPDDLAMAF